jgi:hypothetical protein
VKDTVSKKYQAPDVTKDKLTQPIIEIVTRINGTAERDKTAQVYNPDGTIYRIRPGLPNAPVGSTEKPAKLKPYKLEEIAIESLGGTKILVHSPLLLQALRSIITYYPLQRIPGFRGPAIFREPYVRLAFLL